MLANNPLKQYFRRPSLYFKLPSEGTGYSSSVLTLPPNKELPVYPMTALDEMTIRTPDGLFNGAAVVELIKSCVPGILDPWQLNSVDLDAVLVAVKAASGDGKMAINTQCPSCSEETEFDVDLLPILGSIENVNYSEVLQINELKVKFKALTYAETNKNNLDQFQLQKTLATLDGYEDEDQKRDAMNDVIKKLGELVTKIIAETIEYIETPETRVTDRDFIVDFLNNTDRDSSNLVKNRSIELREKNELKPLDVKCPHCQHAYKQKIILNATDFFD